MKFKKNQNYYFTKIEQYTNANELELEELGNNTIGENFLIIKDEDKSSSFVLTGTSIHGYIYECCYTDT